MKSSVPCRVLLHCNYSLCLQITFSIYYPNLQDFTNHVSITNSVCFLLFCLASMPSLSRHPLCLNGQSAELHAVEYIYVQQPYRTHKVHYLKNTRDKQVCIQIILTSSVFQLFCFMNPLKLYQHSIGLSFASNQICVPNLFYWI